MNVNFDKLIGQNAKLYACNDLNCFQLGTVVFEVLEDESDGYRSYLGEVKIVRADAEKGAFLDEVIIQDIGGENNNEGYNLVSTRTKHVWLSFGTNNDDSYYPCFFFSFTPYNIENELSTLINQ